MNSLTYFPISITRTHPLLFPLSAPAKRGNLLKYNASTPFFATAEKGSRPVPIAIGSYRELSGGEMSTCNQRRRLTAQQFKYINKLNSKFNIS